MMFFETPVSFIPETSTVRKIKEIDEIKDEPPLKKMDIVDENKSSTEEVVADAEESNEEKIEKEIISDEKSVDENDSSNENKEEEKEVKDGNETEEDEDGDKNDKEDETEEVAEEVAEEVGEDQSTKADSSDKNKDDVICIDDEKEDEGSVEDLIQKHSIKELRLMCKEKGLTQGGSKNDLASRILNDSKSVSVINIIS